LHAYTRARARAHTHTHTHTSHHKQAEIQLDPLETIVDSGAPEPQLHETQFIQALHQVEDIDPKTMRVRMPSGGDLVFPLHVRLLGESVAGSSGSFREVGVTLPFDSTQLAPV
jgi:hypothetical protein